MIWRALLPRQNVGRGEYISNGRITTTEVPAQSPSSSTAVSFTHSPSMVLNLDSRSSSVLTTSSPSTRSSASALTRSSGPSGPSIVELQRAAAPLHSTNVLRAVVRQLVVAKAFGVRAGTAGRTGDLGALTGRFETTHHRALLSRADSARARARAPRRTVGQPQLRKLRAGHAARLAALCGACARALGSRSATPRGPRPTTSRGPRSATLCAPLRPHLGHSVQHERLEFRRVV